jgi:hypothetical protein
LLLLFVAGLLFPGSNPNGSDPEKASEPNRRLGGIVDSHNCARLFGAGSQRRKRSPQSPSLGVEDVNTASLLVCGFKHLKNLRDLAFVAVTVIALRDGFVV